MAFSKYNKYRKYRKSSRGAFKRRYRSYRKYNKRSYAKFYLPHPNEPKPSILEDAARAGATRFSANSGGVLGTAAGTAAATYLALASRRILGLL